jgi:predicted transcriptional regulator
MSEPRAVVKISATMLRRQVYETIREIHDGGAPRVVTINGESLVCIVPLPAFGAATDLVFSIGGRLEKEIREAADAAEQSRKAFVVDAILDRIERDRNETAELRDALAAEECSARPTIKAMENCETIDPMSRHDEQREP